tara:strand:+ start:143 stop:523 length:381 start_codon:yes stop_codon:yes gene_type:complete
MSSNMVKYFLSISDLCKKLDLINKKTGKPANHILRFWEKEFRGIKPTLLKGNRRYYDKKQVDKIKFIKYLLKDKGLTIKGVKKVLKDKKNIDVIDDNNVREDYIKNNIKSKSKIILKKLKELKNYG